jgi:hypothetical protein
LSDNATLLYFIQLAQLALTQGRGNGDIEKILYAGDQNTVCQLMLSVTQMLNSMSSATLAAAIAG